MIPFIDAHSHLHGLPYQDWEILGMCGVRAVVLSCSNPNVHREIHSEPPGYEAMLRYWEGPLLLSRAAERTHFFQVYLGIAISSQTRVNDIDRLLVKMEELLQDEAVVAVGELGLDPIQYFGFSWPLEEQAVVMEEQIKMAARLGKPVILHTPTPKRGQDFLGALAHGDLPPSQEYKRVFLEKDLEIIARAGLDQRRVVVDHGDETIIEDVLDKTQAWIGLSIGSALRKTGPKEAALFVKRYGAERIMLNSDHISYLPYDLFAIPKAIREMKRLNVPESEIRRAVFDNANAFYGLGLTP